MKFEVFISKNKYILAVLCLTVLAIFLRSYNLDKKLHFAYDQGRDALVIRQLIKEGKPILIGPSTGIKGEYLGPFFLLLVSSCLFFWQWRSCFGRNFSGNFKRAKHHFNL